jgi:AbrB family looped-hinge helix DNA binding protein
MSARAKVTAAGRLSLPAEVRKRHGLSKGGEVVIQDTPDAIIIRTVAQTVATAQAISRKLLAGKSGASLDDFLRERQTEEDRG